MDKIKIGIVIGIILLVIYLFYNKFINIRVETFKYDKTEIMDLNQKQIYDIIDVRGDNAYSSVDYSGNVYNDKDLAEKATDECKGNERCYLASHGNNSDLNIDKEKILEKIMNSRGGNDIGQISNADFNEFINVKNVFFNP